VRRAWSRLRRSFRGSPAPSGGRLARPVTLAAGAGIGGSQRTAARSGACVAGANALCLQGGRFRVEVEWRDFAGASGAGRAEPLTGDTGTFWFFNPANTELIVKVLDARGINGQFWVFYGALSNVGYTLRITDTVTGDVRRYENALGTFASVGDTEAF